MKFHYNWEEQLENALLSAIRQPGYQVEPTRREDARFRGNLYVRRSTCPKSGGGVGGRDQQSPPRNPTPRSTRPVRGRFLYHEGSPGLETKQSDVFAAVIACFEKRSIRRSPSKSCLPKPKKTIEDIQAANNTYPVLRPMSAAARTARTTSKSLRESSTAPLCSPVRNFPSPPAGVRTEEAENWLPGSKTERIRTSPEEACARFFF